MRLGQITRVPVNDEVTVTLAIDWGQYKKLLKAISGLPDEEDALDEIGAKICPFVHSIEGVEDSQGNPVEQVTPEVLDTFPPSLARELITAVMQIGQQDGGGVVPPAEGSDS